MSKYLFVLLFVITLFIVSCQASMNTPEKSLSAATCSQDVVDAWDACCESNSFYPCPPGIASNWGCTDTMGDMYYGSDFESDSDALMEGIQDFLDTNVRKDPCIDDLLSDVINDPVWYD